MNTQEPIELDNLVEQAFFVRKFVNKKLIDRQALTTVVQTSLNKRNPLQLVGFWGAMNKYNMDDNDEKTIQQLEQFNLYLSRKLPYGCCWTIILADMHALHNGYPAEHVQHYLDQIRTRLEHKAGIQTLLLKTLWKDYAVEQQIAQRADRTKSCWKQNPLSEALECQASRYSINCKTFTENAQHYYSMRKIEAEIIRILYPEAIFFSISLNKMKPLFPDLPHLYLWSLKRGTSQAPWLMKSVMEGEHEPLGSL
ncbi:hypothetical protein [Paenibacillus piscarius]|uniref:hypothetical protein n=1 Tax=Paenibacillus piscarius TaxID=1089681 RepID=UPI001EE87385|nr:hypothetical protein [Paenibacillus piscarius]